MDTPTSYWQLIRSGIWLGSDSCNVYACECADGMVLVNAGTGEWLQYVDELPKAPVALACTHYFRDHSAGAALASERGIQVYVPEYEEEIFVDPEQHFRQRESYIVYDNLWDRFSPIIPTTVAGVLKDYLPILLAGREFQVIPLPGATVGQVGLMTCLADGSRVVFCGEAIHSHGRVPRIAPFQYNYNDLSGAVMASIAVATLEDLRPDLLLPSLGEPISLRVMEELADLKENLSRLMSVRPELLQRISLAVPPDLERVTDHVWLDRKSVANTWYLISNSGKVMALDYGYEIVSLRSSPDYPKKDRRRALLHGLDALKSQFGVDRIDVVWTSHFHDDHVCGIPVLQRLHGTECWVPENFADLLSAPESHTFPCGWPIPIRVDRELPLSDPFHWEEFTFHMAPMSGHTRFAALLAFEADGKRFAHTGDQYFFEDGVDQFERNRRSQNHVFQNGALLDGYAESGKWMLEWRPDIVLQGHQPAMHTDSAFFAQIAEWTRDYADLAQVVMPLGDDDCHFDLDSWGGRILPYRVVLARVEPFSVEVMVRNPFPREANIEVWLEGPTGWEGERRLLSVGPREEIRCGLGMIPTGACRRQPIALSLRADGLPFGQVAEALVTIGNRGQW